MNKQLPPSPQLVLSLDEAVHLIRSSESAQVLEENISRLESMLDPRMDWSLFWTAMADVNEAAQKWQAQGMRALLELGIRHCRQEAEAAFVAIIIKWQIGFELLSRESGHCFSNLDGREVAQIVQRLYSIKASTRS